MSDEQDQGPGLPLHLQGRGRDDALDVLAELGERVETGSLPGLVRPLLHLLNELSGLEAVYLTSIDWDAGVQTVEVARNVDPTFVVPEGTEVPWQDTLCERSLASGSGWNVDVPATWGDRAGGRDLGIQSYVSVPVELASGAPPFGTLCGASPRRVEADPRIVDVLRLFAQMIATALQRDHALQQAHARADDAERRLADRIRFVAQVEHAMKSPITVIRGWAQTLGARGHDAELRKTGLDAIARTTERLGAQVTDLLREARSTIGAGEVEDVDLRRLAEDLHGLTEPSHPYTVDGELLLRADPVAVGVLVEHLVENAVTHTPPGTAIRVLLNEGTLVVEDDGPGLPDREDLFEPFVSADPGVQGSGLGLHIVLSISEHLGAVLATGASATGGARFEVRFG